jgi:PRTRC genetic system protein E
MPFFSNLADKIAGYTLQLTITKTGNELTVLVYPKISEKDEVQKHIVPMTISGTPTELDQGFFASLGAELDKTKTVAHMIKSYDKGLDKAIAASSGKKDVKSTPVDRKKEAKQPEMKFDKDKDTITETTSSEVKITSDTIEKDVDKETGEIPKVEAAESITAAAAPESEPESKETPEEFQSSQEAENDSDQAPVVEETDPDEEW